MALSNYSELQTSIGDWLLRTDLTAVIPDFIQLAEARMARDPRVRQLTIEDPFVIDAATETVPTGFSAIESLFIIGDNNKYLTIETVDPGGLPEVQQRHQPSGTPRAVAFQDDTTLRFAPVPDQAYDAVLIYWEGVSALSDSNTTNWILTNHPDIYLYGALIESAPYMKDDERIAVWGTRYEAALEELHRHNNETRFGGELIRRVPQAMP